MGVVVKLALVDNLTTAMAQAATRTRANFAPKNGATPISRGVALYLSRCDPCEVL